MTILEVTDLRTHFDMASGPLRAVDGVSFSLERGEVLGIVGESGSGKSVTGFSILGLVDPPGRIMSGSIKFDGASIVGLPEDRMRKLRGRRIAMVFQDPMMTLNPVLRIGTQMEESILAHEPKAGAQAARQRSIEALLRVGIPSAEERMSAYPHQLSGGMRQRVAIAIALLHKPDVIIADEPTTALDVTIQGQILHQMQGLVRETGTAMIWITHDLAVVAGIADQIAVMYAGRIVEQGAVEAVLSRPMHPYTRGLVASIPDPRLRGQPIPFIPGMTPSAGAPVGGCAFRPRCSRAADACAVMPDLVDRGAARMVRCHFPIDERPAATAMATGKAAPDARAPASAESPILTVDRVTKTFIRKPGISGRLLNLVGGNYTTSTLVAVEDVSFQIADGEVVGLVGESGCGKSTLGRTIVGIAPQTSGTISYRGRDDASKVGVKVHSATPNDLAIQMIFQDPFASLNPRMRVDRIIAEAPLRHGMITEAESEAHVVATMKQVGLDPSLRSRYPHQFSGGQRQRIGIARALAVNPALLVCDEAIAALDVSIQAQIINMFMELREQRGLTFLFISHDLGVVSHIADRVLVMYLGRIVEEGPAGELFLAPAHPYTECLVRSVPTIGRGRDSFEPIDGEIPSPLNPPKGCHFHPRCPKAFDRCLIEAPVLRVVAPNRKAACHLHD